MKLFVSLITLFLGISTSAQVHHSTQNSRAINRFIALTADPDRSHFLIQLCSDERGKMNCIQHKRLTSEQYDDFKWELLGKIRNRQLGESYITAGSYAIGGLAGLGVGLLTYTGAVCASALSMVAGPVGFGITAVAAFTQATVFTGAAAYGGYKGTRYLLEKVVSDDYDLPQEVSNQLNELRRSKRVFVIQTPRFENNPILQLLPVE